MSDPVIVIGTGPVGIRFVNELLKSNSLQAVVIFGNEPWQPYNRVKLSSLLASDIRWENISNDEWQKIKQHPNVTHYLNCPIESINKASKFVIDHKGEKYHYSQLVLAVGSRPFLPQIPGINMKGVYTFRDLNDVQALFARQVSTRHVCVLGGGLLGIETAKALVRHNTKVTIIQRAEHIMNNQLDSECAQLLAEKISSEQIDILCGEGVVEVLGDTSVTGVRLRNGNILECDTVVVSTGILPNKEIAFAAELAVGRGIKVNDKLQTSDPAIYAIGECAEHRGNTYGVVAPGFEQAAISAKLIADPSSKVSYLGSTTSAELKVIGEQVFSVGEVELPNAPRCKQYIFSKDNTYRKIIIRAGVVIGAQSIGEWAESKRITELCINQKKVSLLQLWEFDKTGSLFGENSNQIQSWPDNVIVCQCMSVSKGVLCKAIAAGCKTANDLALKTGASSVCGTCKPLITQLISANKSIKTEPNDKWRSLLQTSIYTLILSFIFLLAPGIAYSLSIQESNLEQLWIDSDFKQISGFSLLALSAFIVLMSLRKRLKAFKWLQYSTWRFLHTALGVVLLMVLIVHTGLHLGSNLNFALIVSYIVVSIAGTFAGLAVALEHKAKPELASKLRKLSFWGHLLSSWPLPTLLTFHILSVYYF